MNSENQAITETLYVDNSHNSSFSNNVDRKNSWCCNIQACWNNSRVLACKRTDKCTNFNTETSLDDIKLSVIQDGEEPVLGKRKFPTKTKGLNAKHKFRRTFTLCCTHSQNDSFDEEDEEEEKESVDFRERGEDEKDLTEADDKDSNEEQYCKVERREPELFWKLLHPPQTFHEAVCPTPTNVLQVYAADDPLNMPQCDNWQNEDSDESSFSSDDSFFSSEISFSSSDECFLFPEKFDSSTSTSTSSSSDQCYKIPDVYHVNTTNKKMQLSTTSACKNAEQQSLPSDVDLSLCGRLEQTSMSSEISPSVPANATPFFYAAVPSFSLSLHSVSGEPETQGLDKHQITESEDTSQDSEVSTESDPDIEIFRLLSSVYEVVTSGTIGLKRDLVNEPYSIEDRFAVELVHLNSGLPHDEGKRLMTKISDLVNSKHIEFKYSNNLESSMWFTVTSFTRNKLILSQETVTIEPKENEENNMELDKETEQTFDDNVFNCKEETPTVSDEKHYGGAEEITSSGHGNSSSNTDYINTIRQGKFSSVLDKIHKQCDTELESTTEITHHADNVLETENVNRVQHPDYVHVINDGNFSKVLDSVPKSETGCNSFLDENTKDTDNEDFLSAVDSALLACEENDSFPEDSSQTPSEGENIHPELTSREFLMTVLAEGVAYAIKKGFSDPSSTAFSEILSSTQGSTSDNIIKFLKSDTHKTEKSRDVNVSLDSATDQSLSIPTEIPKTDLPSPDCNVSDSLSVTSVKTNSPDNHKTKSNFSFVDNDLLKQPGSTQIESLLSKKQEAIKDKASCAQCINSKAMSSRITSTVENAPGRAQRLKTRNRSTWNQIDQKCKSSVADVQTNGVTKGTVSGSSDTVAKAVKQQTNFSDSNAAGPDHSNRTIKTAKRRLKNATKTENNESSTVSVQPETARSSVPVHPEEVSSALTVEPEVAPLAVPLQSGPDRQQHISQVDEFQSLHFIDTDVDARAHKIEEAPPVYIETDATVDYGRCAVEPGHGERPDKKKLRAEIKEKVKTKGEANKHLKTEKENYFACYEDVMEEYLVDETDDMEDSVNAENGTEEQLEGACAASPVVLNAADQPQVLDDRELKMVPETIKRVDDPFLADVEEDYKVSANHSNKKEKRKQKDARKKEKKTRKGGQTILKLS